VIVFALVLAVLAVVQVVCVLALIDQYKGLLQIRTGLGLIDTPRVLELANLGASPAPSTLGLPTRLDAETAAVVVFLSTTCTICRSIGEGLRGVVPARMWVVVEGPSPEICAHWLEEVQLSGERIVHDIAGQIAARLQLQVVPAALVFDRGKLKHAQTLPSFRQLERVLSQSPTRFSASIH
jgi:hypothetical protein